MSKELRFNISEIFYSIQGESSLAGIPTVFVRLQGCNMRCIWCDTDYSLDIKKQVRLMTIDEIIDAIDKYDCKYICVTGGEPMLQTGIENLLNTLLEKKYKVSLETNGHYSLAKLNAGVIKIVDFKCPDSGMDKLNNFENIQYLNKNDEVKFVLASKQDYDWSKDIIQVYKINEKVNNVLMSVVFDSLKPEEVVNWILEDNLDVRFQIQMHKIIWEPNTRGV